MNEQWECLNCFYLAALDTHGKCARCGSDAVFPAPPNSGTFRQAFIDGWYNREQDKNSLPRQR